MDGDGRILERHTVYEGAIFSVEDLLIALPKLGGGELTIRRQVLRHAPSVVVLVHDRPTDRYLLEREYRAGSDSFAYGLPAGLMDPGEDVLQAALRELAEETGIVPEPASMRVDHVGDCYSSEGMADELVNVMVMHLVEWKREATNFDQDEHVESAWVSWEDLLSAGIRASNAVIAIQHEQLRRAQRR